MVIDADSKINKTAGKFKHTTGRYIKLIIEIDSSRI